MEDETGPGKRLQGAVYVRNLDDGREVVVYPTTYGKGRLCIGPQGWDSFDDAYCYAVCPEAVVAASQWDGEGEPQGWIRHIQSGRRRPNGDASREYVNR